MGYNFREVFQIIVHRQDPPVLTEELCKRCPRGVGVLPIMVGANYPCQGCFPVFGGNIVPHNGLYEKLCPKGVHSQASGI